MEFVFPEALLSRNVLKRFSSGSPFHQFFETRQFPSSQGAMKV